MILLWRLKAMLTELGINVKFRHSHHFFLLLTIKTVFVLNCSLHIKSLTFKTFTKKSLSIERTHLNVFHTVVVISSIKSKNVCRSRSVCLLISQ